MLLQPNTITYNNWKKTYLRPQTTHMMNRVATSHHCRPPGLSIPSLIWGQMEAVWGGFVGNWNKHLENKRIGKLHWNVAFDQSDVQKNLIQTKSFDYKNLLNSVIFCSTGFVTFSVIKIIWMRFYLNGNHDTQYLRSTRSKELTWSISFSQNSTTLSTDLFVFGRPSRQQFSVFHAWPHFDQGSSQWNE